MKKKALVAGAAGLIGSHLCDLLLHKGYEVSGLDNLITGRRDNLKAAIGAGLKFIDTNIIAPLPELGRFDEIYNLASPASPVDFSRLPVFIMETASIGHQRLLELAKRDGSRILFASTSEVYGDPLVHPQREDYFGNVNPTGPRGCYDEAKRFGEALTYAYMRQHDVEVRVARIFNTYGARMRPNDGRIIPNFFIQGLQRQPISVYGDGSQTRSFCFVTDLAAGMHQLMLSAEKMPVNIGNPHEHTVLEIASMVNRLTGNPTPIRHLPLPENDPKQRRPDIGKARALLAWEPRVSLKDGLDVCLNYFSEELRAAEGTINAPVIGA